MLKNQSAAPDELLDDVLAHLTMEDSAVLEIVAEEISQGQGESRLSASEIGNRAKADRPRVSHALELGEHYGFWTIERDAAGGIEVIRFASGLRRWQEQRAFEKQSGKR